MSQRIMIMIGVLMLQMMMLRSVNGQFGGGGGGGPSTFGYDASSACSKPYSRNGRARFEKLPCDFRRQNWCTVAGNSYPWQAVRRFVQENHGLMKRMYGDERHINILKAELEKNDIELEYENRNERYPEDARRFQFLDDYEFVDFDRHHENHNHRSKSGDPDFYQGRSFSGSSIDESVTDESAEFASSSSEFTQPRAPSTDSSSISPTTTTTTTTTSSSTTTTTGKLSSTTSTRSATDFTRSSTDSTRSATDTTLSSTDFDRSSTDFTSTPKTTNLDAKITSTIPPIVSKIDGKKNISTTDEKIASGFVKNSTTIEKIDSTVGAVTLADIARIKNSSLNEIPGQLERLKDDNLDGIKETPVSESTIGDTTFEIEANVASTIDRMDQDDPNDSFKDSVTIDAAFAATENHNQQEFRPRPEYKPAETIKPENLNHKSQLFQDVAAKDKQDQPVLKLRGVNACPVKEEVVAPFWANNTRGEVLALLNLYPFEQYVHWEKCTHENKQMYCRDGCRCEQQYRLHRLLAYDPNNECRGIFSDWFKFPSCCVCRCYDLPVEFRVTSRSPRMQKQKLRLRTPGNRRG